MSSSLEDARLPPPLDHTQVGDRPAVFTDEALLRFEHGLRAQREQAAQHFSELDVASSCCRSSVPWPDLTEPISENPPLAPGADQPETRREQRVASPSGRLRKLLLSLCALVLGLGAAASGVLLIGRIGASFNAAERSSAPLGDDKPHQPVTNAVKSLTIPPLTEEPVGAHDAPDTKTVTDAVKSSAAPSLQAPLSSAPPNEQPVEPQGTAVPAASAPAAVKALAGPAASDTFHRERPMTHAAKRKGRAHRGGSPR